jgi:hypothetical protein
VGSHGAEPVEYVTPSLDQALPTGIDAFAMPSAFVPLQDRAPDDLLAREALARGQGCQRTFEFIVGSECERHPEMIPLW